MCYIIANFKVEDHDGQPDLLVQKLYDFAYPSEAMAENVLWDVFNDYAKGENLEHIQQYFDYPLGLMNIHDGTVVLYIDNPEPRTADNNRQQWDEHREAILFGLSGDQHARRLRERGEAAQELFADPDIPVNTPDDLEKAVETFLMLKTVEKALGIPAETLIDQMLGEDTSSTVTVTDTAAPVKPHGLKVRGQ